MAGDLLGAAVLGMSTMESVVKLVERWQTTTTRTTTTSTSTQTQAQAQAEAEAEAQAQAQKATREVTSEVMSEVAHFRSSESAPTLSLIGDLRTLLRTPFRSILLYFTRFLRKF